MKRRLCLFFALFLFLLSGCEERSSSARLVVSSMGVDCSGDSLSAMLEIIRGDQNETMTVQGENMTELFSDAERQSGEPLYLGALQSIVFSGVADGSTLRDYLLALLADGRIAPNTQIALCDDAMTIFSEEITGDDITALLTAQYTDSRSCGLKELVNLLDGEGRDGLLLWLSAEEGTLRESGILPTGSSDYSDPLPSNALCRLLKHRAGELRRTIPVGVAEVTVLLRRLAVSGVHFCAEKTDVALSAEATVLTVSGTAPTRKQLEAALQNDLREMLEELDLTVMRGRRSDILGLTARAELAGITAEKSALSHTVYTPRIVLRDPCGRLA